MNLQTAITKMERLDKVFTEFQNNNINEDDVINKCMSIAIIVNSELIEDIKTRSQNKREYAYNLIESLRRYYVKEIKNIEN